MVKNLKVVNDACGLQCDSSGRTGYYPVDRAILPDQRKIKAGFHK